MKSIFGKVLVLVLVLISPALIHAQADRGTITGTITDSTGAVLGSVSILATQSSTAVQFKGVSNDHGFYTLTNLPIGSYNLSFSGAGFKVFNQNGIVLATQHTASLNVVMQIGTVSESIEVSGTPVLEIQTEVGTNISSSAMTDLPLTANGGRDITNFAFSITPNVSGGEWSSNIAGSQGFTKSVLIDGTSVDSGIVGHVGESEPSMDAIQESQVDTTGLRAEDGRSGGGAFLYEMKSGTAHFHGSAFGFLANEFLNANTWTNNWYLSQCAANDTTCNNTYRRGKDRFFDYGVSGGGPIWRKHKMFIFGAYEKYQQADWRETPNSGTVPTTKMLTGDFSELLAAASGAVKGCTATPCPIMNGSSPTKDAAGNVIYYGAIFAPSGDVYPGNIMTDPISPIAQKVISVYQQYYKPTGPGVTRNFPTLYNNEPAFTQNQLSFKFDWALRDSDHIAVSYIYNLRPRTCTGACGAASNTVLWQPGSTTGGPLSFGLQQTVISNEYRASETHTFSPNLLNVLAFTFNSFQNKSVPTTSIADATNWPSQIGFGNVDPLNIFPYMKLNGSPNGFGETPVGNYYGTGGYVAYNGIFNESLSWAKGRHNFKFGGEMRALGFNSNSGGGALQFSFSNNTFAPTNSSIQPYVGSALANMMLGQVQSASQGVTFSQDSRRKELAFYAQDDIKITSRLTMNADLRWELTQPLHVLHGDWSNFDANASNQALGGVKGAVTWLDNPNGSFETYADWHQLAPKFGVAYQASKKMVIRGSLGMNFVPLGWNGYSGVPYGSAVGYTATNQVVQVSTQNPAYQWDKTNYPGTYTAPTGPNPKSSYIPWGPSNVDPHSRQLGLAENWFAGIQYELPGHSTVEVSYLGTSGRNLHDGSLNPTNFPTWDVYSKLLNSGKIWNWVSDASSAASAGVPYLYPGFSGSAYFALNPYPQVQSCYCGGVLFTNSPLGQSGYNAFTIEGKKQRGALNLDLSFNWARTTGNAGSAFFDTWTFNHWYQDPYKYKQEAHWPHTNDTVKGYLTYVLPLGTGRRFLSHSRRLDYFVAGWQPGTIVSYGNGGQMGAVGSSNSYPGWSAVYTNVVAQPNFKNHFKKYNPGWNPSAAGAGTDPNSLFVDPSNFSNPTYGQLGNSPSVFSNWRGWAAPHEDASLLKKTRFGSDGRYVVTLRAEFFDVFNRHYYSGPNTNFGNAALFGHVTGVSGNRTGQLGARFEW